MPRRVPLRDIRDCQTANRVSLEVTERRNANVAEQARSKVAS